ncbi:MAG: hypothetical protein VX834_03155, partial [Myxococcota bacterium]|nr:hypothetical protein [Myxococcota bacterium]
MQVRLIMVATSLAVMLGSAGCSQDILTSVSYKTEEFIQNARPKVDILWVVDNSNSMASNQAGIGQSFEAFINNLVSTQVDYHIGVVSSDISDGGQLHSGVSGEVYITPNTIAAQNAFLENVQVGISGSAVERSFESAALALGVGIGQWNPGDAPAQPNVGFLRDDASLFIIMVSDEDDKSFGPVEYYKKLFESYKGPGNEGLISVSAIVGDYGEGCRSDVGFANPGDRYIELASQTEGISESICNEFSDTLRSLSISASGLNSQFNLDGVPNQDARIPCGDLEQTFLCVYVDDVPVPRGTLSSGWLYEETSNAVIFGAADVPLPQSKIQVRFQDIGGRVQTGAAQ